MATNVKENEKMAVLTLQLAKSKDLYKAELERLDATRLRVKQTFLFLTVFSIMIGSFFAWTAIQSYRFRKQFGNLIKVIDDARSTGNYSGPDGLSTIWAYEYGQLGSFLAGFTSPDLAVAIVTAYYDSEFNAAFMGTDQGASSLGKMMDLSRRGDFNANQIMCLALFGANDDGTPKKCMPNCNASSVTTQAGTASAYLGAITAGAGGGVGLGFVISSMVAGPVGLAAGIAGGLAVMGTSVFTTSSNLSKQRKACQDSLKGCINVAGVSC